LTSPSPPVEVDLDSVDSMTAYLERCDREYGRAIHPIVRLDECGADWGVAPAEEDEIGYAMHPFRTDDCLRPAIATVTQIPIEQVPDLRLDQRAEDGEDDDAISASSWTAIEEWAASNRLRMRSWRTPPVARRRWIGVVVVEGGLYDHCLVMDGERILFDPAYSVALPPGHRLHEYTAESVTYGISFEKEE
jgi:hypothetical protein